MARITKQTIDTLRAIGDDDGITREVLAKRLGIPYSSACGRIRRMIAAGLVDCPPGEELIIITDDGLDLRTREA